MSDNFCSCDACEIERLKTTIEKQAAEIAELETTLIEGINLLHSILKYGREFPYICAIEASLVSDSDDFITKHTDKNEEAVG